jgi:3-dehydroquinate synthase
MTGLEIALGNETIIDFERSEQSKALEMSTLHVNLGPRGYDIVMGAKFADGFGRFAASVLPGRSAFLVSDRNLFAQEHPDRLLASLQAAGFRIGSLELVPGEERKSLESLSVVYDKLADFGADRQTVVIAMGGGVVGDLAGFAAATFNRGLPWIMVPTTLLAMIDSSVGGKVGINHPAGKNLIGAFHQPRAVWIDLEYLSTLGRREFRSGLAEAVKYGMILDEDLFCWLEQNHLNIAKPSHADLEHLVHRCCQIKATIVKRDELDQTGLRAVLNYGHTFAQAFERVAGYGVLLHGEAVAMGMDCAARAAQQLGWIGSDVVQRQRMLLHLLDLPTTYAAEWPLPDLLEAMRHDKKSESGQFRLVLPRRIGHMETNVQVSESLIRQVLSSHTLRAEA